ncbi:uncharacterized protein LOC128672122 [Plodia interpunctella]|uniref:uncharacterized protein LOC128672122 n=1 Tax=Plodia interpunctella TaxID=58824 RepID=UPI0023677EE4|nr:uncharacterized protein LOC128672122 [Plodia interpunctella]
MTPRISVIQPRTTSNPIKVVGFNKGNTKTKESLRSLKSTWFNDRRESRELKLQEERELERLAYKKQLEELKKAQKRYEREIAEEQKRKEEEQKRKEEEQKIKEWEQRRLTLETLERAKSERLERLRQEREKEVLEHLKAQEKYLLKSYTDQLRVEADNTYYNNNDDIEQNLVKGKKVKVKKVKEKREKKAKKTGREKTVYVNNYQRESWKDRFAHWFYRVCCQFYCYLTCVLTVIFVIIYVI